MVLSIIRLISDFEGWRRQSERICLGDSCTLCKLAASQYRVEFTTWLATTEKTLSLTRGHSVMSLHQTTRLQRDNGVCFIGEAEKERPLTIVDAVVWSWWLDAEGAV